MLTAEQFIECWEGDEEPLLIFTLEAIDDLGISNLAKYFLVAAGLPAAAAPFLHFEPPESGPVPTLTEQFDLPASFRRYRVIGSYCENDPIAIDDDANGTVVLLRQKGSFQRVLVSSSIPQLAESLLVCRQMIDDAIAQNGEDAILTGDIPPKVRSRAEAKLRRIDPSAMESGCFWATALEFLADGVSG